MCIQYTHFRIVLALTRRRRQSVSQSFHPLCCHAINRVYRLLLPEGLSLAYHYSAPFLRYSSGRVSDDFIFHVYPACSVALESGWMVVEFYDALFAGIGFNFAGLTSPLLSLLADIQLIVCRRVCYFWPKRCSPLVLLLCFC